MIEWTTELREGIRLFNEQEFFECHEVLEDAWRAEQGEMRDLYQGLIKVAVAFYHCQNMNFEGAIKVMKSGLPQLKPYESEFQLFDLRSLIASLEHWLVRFESLRQSNAMMELKEIPKITQT